MKYFLEYVDNKSDWDKVCEECFHYEKYGKEPWDFYKVREFDNTSSAFYYYMVYYFNPNIYDVKLYEEDTNEWIEVDSTFKYMIQRAVSEDMQKEINNLRQTNNSLNQELSTFKEYTELTKDLYKQFLEKKGI